MREQNLDLDALRYRDTDHNTECGRPVDIKRLLRDEFEEVPAEAVAGERRHLEILGRNESGLRQQEWHNRQRSRGQGAAHGGRRLSLCACGVLGEQFGNRLVDDGLALRRVEVDRLVGPHRQQPPPAAGLQKHHDQRPHF